MLLFVGIYFIFKGVHNVGRGGSEKNCEAYIRRVWYGVKNDMRSKIHR